MGFKLCKSLVAIIINCRDARFVAVCLMRAEKAE